MMQVEEHRIRVRDVYAEFRDQGEGGVTAYHGKLDIRPKYQREFVYSQQQQQEVIRTILRGLPLNVIYWCKITQDDGSQGYEVLDGQQRLLSICNYVDNKFMVDAPGIQTPCLFRNLPADKQDDIKNYELFVYICDGNESEKLDWFKIINISGEKLLDQELRNAVYTGPWLSSAKHYFSMSECGAYKIGKEYMKGTPIRQDYLETVLYWAVDQFEQDCDATITIEEYMGAHQSDDDATPLWNYFQRIVDWIKIIFPIKRSVMKGLPWGNYYNRYHDRTDLDPQFLEQEIQRLMKDEDVTRKSGIYEYLLTGDERKLNIRAFDIRDKRAVYNAQEGRCAFCGRRFPIEEMHGDHIKPWSKGGTTTRDNLRMLCRECNIKLGAHGGY